MLKEISRASVWKSVATPTFSVSSATLNLKLPKAINIIYHTHHELIKQRLRAPTLLGYIQRSFCRRLCYWSNLTVTSTLLTDYCKHSIKTKIANEQVIHNFENLFTLKTSQKEAVAISQKRTMIFMTYSLRGHARMWGKYFKKVYITWEAACITIIVRVGRGVWWGIAVYMIVTTMQARSQD